MLLHYLLRVFWLFSEFLLFGIAVDGFSISAMNLVIEISPEDKRPIYTALQTNLSSIGLFFPILGAGILKLTDNNYTYLYATTIMILVLGFLVSINLNRVESKNLNSNSK